MRQVVKPCWWHMLCTMSRAAVLLATTTARLPVPVMMPWSSADRQPSLPAMAMQGRSTVTQTLFLTKVPSGHMIALQAQIRVMPTQITCEVRVPLMMLCSNYMHSEVQGVQDSLGKLQMPQADSLGQGGTIG